MSFSGMVVAEVINSNLSQMCRIYQAALREEVQAILCKGVCPHKKCWGQVAAIETSIKIFSPSLDAYLARKTNAFTSVLSRK